MPRLMDPGFQKALVFVRPFGSLTNPSSTLGSGNEILGADRRHVKVGVARFPTPRALFISALAALGGVGEMPRCKGGGLLGTSKVDENCEDWTLRLVA